MSAICDEPICCHTKNKINSNPSNNAKVYGNLNCDLSLAAATAQMDDLS